MNSTHPRWSWHRALFCVAALSFAGPLSAEIAAGDYQVPISPAPTTVDEAIATIPERQRTVTAVVACGNEFGFVRNVRVKSNGEGIAAEILGKLNWIRLGRQTQNPARFAVIIPACEFTIAVDAKMVCKVFFANCVSEDKTVREAAEKAFETHSAWLALVNWPADGEYSPNVEPVRGGILAWLPSSCQDPLDGGAPRYSIRASKPADNDKPPAQVRLTFTIAHECLNDQANIALLEMKRGEIQVGTDKTACNLINETKGDWDATLKNLIRIAELDRRQPLLSVEARSHLNDDLIDIDGGPASEAYPLWECGNEERSVGTPQERSDEKGSVEQILEDVGDSGWNWLVLLILILALLYAAAIYGLAKAAGAIIAVVVAAIAGGVVAALLLIQIPETENHLLMINSTKYLNNQYIINNGGDAFKSDQEDLRDWLLKDIQRIVKNDFIEYNSRPYQRYSLVAIANLADFSQNDQVRTAARSALEYAVAKYAVMSNEARRIAPYRRKREDMGSVDGVPRGDKVIAPNGLFDLSGGADHLHALGLYYFGQSLNLPEFDKAWYAAAKSYASHAIYYASSDYLPDPAIFSLVIDRDRDDLIHQRIHHDGYEISSSGASFTITAGGLTTGMAKNATIDLIDQIKVPDDLGAAVPTTVMFKGALHIPPTFEAEAIRRPLETRRSTLQSFIRFEGELPDTEDTTPSYDRNLCVWDGFACGVNMRLPADLSPGSPCMSPGASPDWYFVRSDAPDCTAYNQGPKFWMTVFYEAENHDISDFGEISSYGFLEIVDGDEMSFEDFKSRVESRNPGPDAPMEVEDDCGGVYVSGRGSPGQRIEFTCERVTKVDSHVQSDPDDWTHAIAPPGALGYAPLQSSGDGRVEITARAAKRRVTLNFTDWKDPEILLTVLQ